MKHILRKGLLFCLLALLLPTLPAFSAGKRAVWGYQGSVAYFEEGGKIGLLKKGMGTLIAAAPLMDEVTPFVDGLATMRKGTLWGLLRNDGRYVLAPCSVIPVRFPFDPQFARIKTEDGQFGFVSRRGEIVMEPTGEYLSVQPMSESLIAAKTEQGYGYIDVNGKTVIEFQYKNALPFSEGLAAVQKDGKWGYIDKEGKTVIPFAYHTAGKFAQGLADVRESSSAAPVYIDREGAVVLTGEWSEAFGFSKDGLAKVRVGDKVGFINAKGKMVISAKYLDATDFGDGMAAVKFKVNEWKYINTKGKIVSKLYVEAGEYQNGFAPVTFENREKKGELMKGYINVNRFFVTMEVGE